MAYVNGRLVHDADSHLMELSDCLDPYFERRLLSRFHAMPAFHSRKDRGTRPGQSAAAHLPEDQSAHQQQHSDRCADEGSASPFWRGRHRLRHHILENVSAI